MPADDDEGKPKVPKLHDDAPKRVMTLGATAVETENGQRFSPGALAWRSDHNGAPKRDMKPIGAITVGAEALGFRPKSTPTTPKEPWAAHRHQTKPPRLGLGGRHCRSSTNARKPRRPLHAIPMT
jgi:hypothetical protein